MTDVPQPGSRASERQVRVLLCKPGLDGHDRGVKIVARALRDSGMEVIYMGMRVSAAEVASAAIDEDVDVIGVSNHSASLVVLCEDIRLAMANAGATDIPIVAGGTVLQEDVEALREMGVEAVFGPGADTDAIIVAIRNAAARREST